MRDVLRWVLHWLSAAPAVVGVDYVVSADVEIRTVATADVEMRLTASADVEL
jgi:hypothetical protein